MIALPRTAASLFVAGGILNVRPVNSSVRRTQRQDLFDESVWL